MIKKVGMLLFVLTTIFLLISLASSQMNDEGIPEEIEGITNTTEKIADIGSNLSSVNISSTNFSSSDGTNLTQEWTHPFFTDTGIGKAISKIGSVFKALSPIFKIFIGVEYSISWLFFLSLGVWIAILILIYKPIRAFLQTKPWISFLIALIIITLGAQFKIIPGIVSLFTPIFKNKWIIIITIIITGVLLYFFSSLINTLGKQFQEQIKKENEERREQKSKTVEKMNDIHMKASGV